MKKIIYFLFKEIIPNFLLSIFFILLFDVLNFGVEIAHSKYVFFVSLYFTFFIYFVFNIINIFQVRMFKKYSIQDILYDKKNKVLISLLTFKLLNIISSIGIYLLASIRYSENIVYQSLLIPLIIGFCIEIIKIVLNRVFKFDKIITLNQSQEELNEKIEDMLKDMMDDNPNDKIIDTKDILKKDTYKDPKARNDDSDEKR